MVKNDRLPKTDHWPKIAYGHKNPMDLNKFCFHRFHSDIVLFLPIKQKNLQKILKLFVCYVEIALDFVSSVK